MAQHRLVVDKHLIQHDFDSVHGYSPDIRHKYQLFYQMARITRDRGALSQDDRLDAVAMAVGDCVAQMSLDADNRVRERQEELLLQELELWTDSVMNPELSLISAQGGDSAALWCGQKTYTPGKGELLGLQTGSGFITAHR